MWHFGHRFGGLVVPNARATERKKPTWWNTRRYSTTSAYSSTGPPPMAECLLNRHPTSSTFIVRIQAREANEFFRFGQKHVRPKGHPPAPDRRPPRRPPTLPAPAGTKSGPPRLPETRIQSQERAYGTAVQ